MVDPAVSDPVIADALPTLLVVEDEVLVRLVIAEYLRDCGYKVIEASDVAEAKAVLEADTDVELVFSDVQMPGEGDGFALATWIRQHYPTVDVILTSGLPGAAEKARDLCHEGSLVAKPYDHGSILRRVQELSRARAKARLSK